MGLIILHSSRQKNLSRSFLSHWNTSSREALLETCFHFLDFLFNNHLLVWIRVTRHKKRNIFIQKPVQKDGLEFYGSLFVGQCLWVRTNFIVSGSDTAVLGPARSSLSIFLPGRIWPCLPGGVISRTWKGEILLIPTEDIWQLLTRVLEILPCIETFC